MADYRMTRFHTFHVHEGIAPFTVPKRYKDLRFIKAGAQGIVVSAIDSVSGNQVAIKKTLKPAVSSITAINALIVIKVFSVFTPEEKVSNFEDVYMVMEFLPYTLELVIKTAKLDHKSLSKFIYQILCGVHHLHREGIIHRDLKPSNVVINQSYELKILDLGLARQTSPEQMSQYVTTRYYRAPEITLDMKYSEKADVWSVGCIIVEMITGKAIFQGRDKSDQWIKIVEIMGTPSDNFIAQQTRRTANHMRSTASSTPKSFEEIIPDSSFIATTENAQCHWTATDARRLVSKMLVIDPDERCSIADALRDPYVSAWCMDEEVNAPLLRTEDDISQITRHIHLRKLKTIIFNEVKRIESTQDIFGGI